MNTTAVINNQLSALAEAIKLNIKLGNSGSTFNFNAGVISKEIGYFVSYKSPSIKLSLSKFNRLSTNEIVDLLKNLYFKVNKDSFIGYWINKENIYIDLTRYILDESEALKFGTIQDQLAIWDCKNSREVALW